MKNEYSLKLRETFVDYLEKIDNPRILEFGVRHGISTEIFIDICERKKGFITSVDIDDNSKKFETDSSGTTTSGRAYITGTILQGTTDSGEANGDEATFANTGGNAGITIRSAVNAETKIYFSKSERALLFIFTSLC